MIAESMGITIASGRDARDVQLSVQFHECRSTGITSRRIAFAVVVKVPFNMCRRYIVYWRLAHCFVAKVSIRATRAASCFAKTDECQYLSDLRYDSIDLNRRDSVHRTVQLHDRNIIAGSKVVGIIVRMDGYFCRSIRLSIYLKRAFCVPDESSAFALHTVGGCQHNVRSDQRSRASVVNDSYGAVVARGSTVDDSRFGPGMVRRFQLCAVVAVDRRNRLRTNVVHGGSDSRQDSPNLQRLVGIRHC